MLAIERSWRGLAIEPVIHDALLAVTRTGEKASEVPIRCLSAEDLLVAWSSPDG